MKVYTPPLQMQIQQELRCILGTVQLPTVPNDERILEEASISLAEVTSAISNPPNGKVCRTDDLLAELYKLLTDQLGEILNGFEIPRDFMEAVIVSFLKKDKPAD
ncbi:hypothetical protein NDU88_000207 [Pleurodeles waltl]|uniref:Uncharacterized protein n=1 Tax=Pleurodeles waltl TaxID=8319 RepID=A0AAV7TEW0_PLEWA|nr:hypothetical protein NDU88_000207 [Pleurodeles waltl]